MRNNLRNLLTAIVFGFVFPSIMLGLFFSEKSRPPASIQTDCTVSVSETKAAEPEIYITICNENGQTEEMALEHYVSCVVLKEMPADFPTEALKAQAVAARTYVVRRIVTGQKHENAAVCTDPACCQAFCRPEDYIENGGSEESVQIVKQAVAQTAGEILCYDEMPIEATYFSSSGGMTEASVAVWGEDIPYLQATESPEAQAGDTQTRTICITRGELSLRLGIPVSGKPDSWFKDLTYTEGEGIATATVCGKVYTGTQLRSQLGLRSTAFSVEAGVDCVYITTRGYGHRVGMSQYGAQALADSGSTYLEILQHYYNGTKISNCKAYLS